MAVLSRHARTALDALCRRIIPAAFEERTAVDIVTHVELRIASLDAAMRRDVIGALNFFDHPITGMLLSGRPRRFSTLPAVEQDALLREWERSSLALRRTVFQAMRRLILSTYYALPQSHAAIGFLAPLHLRLPAFDWEGPAPVRDSTSPEPVLRRADADVAAAVRARGSTWSATHRARIANGMALGADGRVKADVCVIGSGAGGAVAAARLASAGLDVVVLEEGGFFTEKDFDEDESRLMPLLYADNAARATDDLSIVLLQGRCVGGGTTVNWMMTLRPRPWVMDEWEHEHRIELLSARMLDPVLAAMEHDINALPVPDDAHSPSNRVILDGSAHLGWRTIEARVNARGCIRAGSCGLGCRWGAKQGAGAVFLPRALDDGARLLCDVRADRIEIDGGRKRIHAVALDRTTREPRNRITIDATTVVLASGAVGTPTILERSGLGGGGVGRWLRLHPTTAVVGRYAKPMYIAGGVPQSAVCGEFLEGKDGYGFWIECPPLRPGLTAAAVPGFGAEHAAQMRDFANYGVLIVLVRDGAERNRSAGEVHVDRRGRTHIRYRMSRADTACLSSGVQAAARLHLAAGAEHSLSLHTGARPIRAEADVRKLAHQSYGPNRISLFSAHVNGTCRLGHDPRESGCAPDGQRHGVPGLYVVDGSLLPTAPGVNPQLTIMALADLVARNITAAHRA